MHSAVFFAIPIVVNGLLGSSRRLCDGMSIHCGHRETETANVVGTAFMDATVPLASHSHHPSHLPSTPPGHTDATVTARLSSGNTETGLECSTCGTWCLVIGFIEMLHEDRVAGALEMS